MLGQRKTEVFTMKPTKKSMYCLLSFLLLAGCSDSSNLSDPSSLGEKNGRILKKLEKEIRDQKSKLWGCKSQSKRKDDILSEFVEYLVNKNALEGALLKYFGFNDISKTSDAYIDLCGLGIWSSHDGYRNAMHYYVTRMNRNGENVEALFDKFKPIVFQAISMYVYDNSYANEYVEFLLASRENITKATNYMEFFDKLSNDERINDGDKRDELLGEYEQNFGVLRDDLKLLRHVDAAYQKRTKYWGYSFWYRRHKEGNAKVVESILKEIASYYSSAKSQ